MAELLRHLEANGFTTYIASGGDRDFMRSEAAGGAGTGDYFWSMRTRLPDGSRTAQSRGPHG